MRIIFLVGFLALGVMSCGGSQPTPGSTVTATQEPIPQAEEVRATAENLFTTVATALQEGDAATFHKLLASDLRERCTVEEIQAALAAGEVLTPQLEVKGVYIDLEDNNRVLVDVAAVPLEPEEGLVEGLATALAGAFPWPIVREDGEWRFSLPFLSLLPEEDCPYAAAAQEAEQSDAQGAEQSDAQEVEQSDADVPSPFPVGPELLPGQVEVPRLEPPQGVNILSSGSGRGEGEAFASALLETDMALAALLEYYRQQVLEPDWMVQQEEVTEDLAVLTWIFRDDANRPGYGVLLIAPAGDDQRWVRMWMAGPGLN